MKIVKLFFLISVFSAAGAFTYFAVTEASVQQKQITKTIPNERFFGSNS